MLIRRTPAANKPSVDKPAVRRSFVLDVEEETTQADKDIFGGLLSHDLAAFDEPVALPKTRMRPPSPSFKLLASSTDAKSAIDLVISQVASNDLTTSMQALAQVIHVLRLHSITDLNSLLR